MKGGQRIGAGRPAQADSKRHLVQVRVSDAELESIKETAAHHKMSVSDLVRHALGLVAVLFAVLAGAGCTDSAEPNLYRVSWIFAPDKVAACDELTVGEDWIAFCDEPALEVTLAQDDCDLYAGDGFSWWICSDPDGGVDGELFLDGPPVAAFSGMVSR